MRNEKKRHSDTLKGSQRMGGGQIFLKTFRTSLFNDDLSNEPNFGLIHLAGEYLSSLAENDSKKVRYQYCSHFTLILYEARRLSTV